MKSTRSGIFLIGLMLLITIISISPCSPARAIGPQVAAGYYHSVGLKADGTVVAVGDNSAGQANVSSWTDIVAIGAGLWHTVGLYSDGTVVAVGDNTHGQKDVSTWTDVIAVAAGEYHTVGLKSDGTVVGAGDNDHGQADFSSWTGLTITAIAAGGAHTVGLKSDGTVAAMGDNTYGQTSVSSWTNIIAIAAGNAHTVGLRSDGTVVAVGSNSDGQVNVFGFANIIAIAAGAWHTVGLKSDGTVVAVGGNYGQLNFPPWTNFKAVSAGLYHTLGLRADGTVTAVGNTTNGQLNVFSWRLQPLDTDIKGGRGTQVVLKGSGFGSKKGTVAIGTTGAKVVSWFDTTVIFQVTTPLAPGPYPINVTPVGGASTVYGKPFIMKAPELRFVQASEGYAGDTIVLRGKYFGSKKGTVVLGTKSCPASYWSMDPTSGESMAAFKVPPKMTAGTYNIILTNELGSVTFPVVVFTVKSGESTRAESASDQDQED